MCSANFMSRPGQSHCMTRIRWHKQALAWPQHGRKFVSKHSSSPAHSWEPADAFCVAHHSLVNKSPRWVTQNDKGMLTKYERMFHVNPLGTRCISKFHARPPFCSQHSSHKMCCAKRTAGRGSGNEGLQTWPHVLWVIAVNEGDLKQCSNMSTTFSRECDPF